MGLIITMLVCVFVDFESLILHNHITIYHRNDHIIIHHHQPSLQAKEAIP